MATRAELRFRRPVEDDHPRVLAAVERWWGGLGGAEGAQRRAALLPRACTSGTSPPPAR